MKNKLIRFFTRQMADKQKKLESSISVLEKLNSHEGTSYAHATMLIFFILGICSFAGLTFLFSWLGITVLQLFGAILCWFFIVILVRLVILLLS